MEQPGNLIAGRTTLIQTGMKSVRHQFHHLPRLHPLVNQSFLVSILMHNYTLSHFKMYY